jgi:hypothetical protein
VTRAAAVASAGAICLIGFAISGKFAISGYTDLLWAAAAAAAVILGLVLPRSPQNLALAWICAVTASLTKNEGLTTALIVLVLIVFRYRPLRLAWRRWTRPSLRSCGRFVLGWLERAAFLIVPAIPGLASAWLARRIGLQNVFFGPQAQAGLSGRASATLTAMEPFLKVLPLAAAVTLAGCLALNADRRRAGFGNPVWLWAGWALSLGAIFATYVYGTLAINLWLANSVNRTTIFAQLLLYAYLAFWLVLGLEGALAGHRRTAAEPGAPARDPDGAGTPLRDLADPQPALTCSPLPEEGVG